MQPFFSFWQTSTAREPDCSIWTDFFLLGKAGGYNLNIKFFCKCEVTLQCLLEEDFCFSETVLERAAVEHYRFGGSHGCGMQGKDVRTKQNNHGGNGV